MGEPGTTYTEMRDSLREAAAGELLASNDLNPLPILPDGWPCSGYVRVYGYRTETLPTGTARYRVWSPQVFLRFDLETADYEVHRLESERELGEVSDMGRGPQGDWRPRLRQAEATLLEVCAGEADDDRRSEMKGYLDWLAAEPVFRDVVRQQAPAFFDWLHSS